MRVEIAARQYNVANPSDIKRRIQLRNAGKGMRHHPIMRWTTRRVASVRAAFIRESQLWNAVSLPLPGLGTPDAAELIAAISDAGSNRRSNRRSTAPPSPTGSKPKHFAMSGRPFPEVQSCWSRLLHVREIGFVS